MRHNGFATNHGELTVNGRAIAVPVLDANGLAYAAVEVEVEVISPVAVEEVLPALRLAAHALNRELHPHTHHRGGRQHEQPLPIERSASATG